jgi:hypothetical protein
MSREFDRHIASAQRDLVTAQYALLAPTRENLAVALLHVGLCLLSIARADPNRRALGILIPILRDAQRKARRGRPEATSDEGGAGRHEGGLAHGDPGESGLACD